MGKGAVVMNLGDALGEVEQWYVVFFFFYSHWAINYEKLF